MTPETLGILTDEARKGVGAETLLRTLGPQLHTRLEYFLLALEQAAPDLDVLLDLRAKITTIRQMQRELVQAVGTGNEAAEKLSQVYN